VIVATAVVTLSQVPAAGVPVNVAVPSGQITPIPLIVGTRNVCVPPVSIVPDVAFVDDVVKFPVPIGDTLKVWPFTAVPGAAISAVIK